MAESAREQHPMSTANLTPVAIETLNRAQLTRVYNSLAERPVKAFATLTVARDRTQALLDQTGRVLDYVGGDFVATSAPVAESAPALPVEVETPVVPATIVTDADAELAVAADEVIDPANLPELTTLEHKMLTALVNSEFHDGTNPVENSVWTHSVYVYADIKERSRGGVVASLVTKGFVKLSTHEIQDDCIQLTRRGLAALQASEAPVEVEPAKGAAQPAPAAGAPRPEPAPRAAKPAGAPRVAGGRTLLDPALRRGPLPSFDDNHTIHLLVSTNPKREGAATHAMFELYKDGMTVAAYVAAGGRRRELNWDVRNGWVKVAGAAR